ncbi:MAG: glycosidase, partial [Chloroflexia bacterium]
MVEAVGPALPHIPWEERPAGCHEVVWRSRRNPVILRNQIPCANSIFNSAVVPFQDGFAGVFRVDHRSRAMHLHRGRSPDGFTWQIDEEPIAFVCDIPELRTIEYA